MPSTCSKNKPDGVWLIPDQDQNSIHMLDGRDLNALAHPTFSREKQAREWLEVQER